MMADAYRVQDLLRRIAAETGGAPYVPARLLTEAADMIEVLAARLGLLGPAVGTARAHPTGSRREPASRPPERDRRASDPATGAADGYLATTIAIIGSMPADPPTPASAPDPAPSPAGGDFSGGGGDSGGGGASGSFD